ncbi:MAG: DUF1016 family protein [Sphingobacteriales bacterium]|nr:MAG: DUF1016 family protein [Sphingobacteriales bacterium]
MNNLDINKPLVNKVSLLISSAQGYVASAVNKGMVLLYWNIGKTIQEEIFQYDKPEYGEQAINNLSIYLSAKYGKGYGYRTLYRMLRFYVFFPEENILTTVLSQLSWSHILEILKQKYAIKREFYITMCSNEGWTVRELSSRLKYAIEL